jgi:hypothetical protein
VHAFLDHEQQRKRKNEASVSQKGVAFFCVPRVSRVLALSNMKCQITREQKNTIKKQQLAKFSTSQRGGKVDVLLVSKINLLINLFS